MTNADRALCLDTMRVLANNNPEGHNQYTAGGASGQPHEYHFARDKTKAPPQPDKAKNEHVDYKGRPVSVGDKRQFSGQGAADKHAKDLHAKGWEVESKYKPGSFGSTGNTEFPFKNVVIARRTRKE